MNILRRRIGPRIGAWAGVIGPALFTATYTAEGWLRPGYDPRSMFVSELSLGPRGGIEIANFLASGALIVLFAASLAVEFKEGKARRIGPVLITVIGFGLMMSGPFVMDPTTTPFWEMSWHSYFHYAFGVVVFSLAPISCFVFSSRFFSDDRWRWFRWWTLAAGLIMTASVVALKAALLPGSLHPYVGAVQRVALIDYMTWLECLAVAVVFKGRVGAP